MMLELVGFAVAGAAGALARDIVRDNRIKLPSVVSGDLSLGVVGGMFVGAFVGYVIDRNPISAAMAGYVGTSAISHLLPEVQNVKRDKSGRYTK